MVGLVLDDVIANLLGRIKANRKNRQSIQDGYCSIGKGLTRAALHSTILVVAKWGLRLEATHYIGSIATNLTAVLGGRIIRFRALGMIME